MPNGVGKRGGMTGRRKVAKGKTGRVRGGAGRTKARRIRGRELTTREMEQHAATIVRWLARNLPAPWGVEYRKMVKRHGVRASAKQLQRSLSELLAEWSKRA